MFGSHWRSLVMVSSWLAASLPASSEAPVYPRMQALGRSLWVVEVRREPRDVRLLLATLQGLVNRKRPRIYLISTEQDEFWLGWLQQTGATGKERRVRNWQQLCREFRGEVRGAVVYDAELPDTINVATMMAALRDGLVCSPGLVGRLDLPVLEDLRGRWKGAREAYRWALRELWPRLNHQAIACLYPEHGAPFVRDYPVAARLFCFWAGDRELFREIMAATPANVPVLGFWGFGDSGKPEEFRGLTEYDGLVLASQYGKFLPGTEFSSNLSVHSGVRAPAGAFVQRPRPKVRLNPSKVYLSLNVLDSGDAMWYWQLRQKEVWEDPYRGKVPIGWSLNIGMLDTQPAVMGWYYRQASAHDEFFAAVSGLGYMSVPHFATQCGEPDRVWRQFIARTRSYMRRSDIHVLGTYRGAWNATGDRLEQLRPFVRGIPELSALLPDLGRHDDMTYEKADYRLGAVPVFHCLTRWRHWRSIEELQGRKEQAEVAALAEEIRQQTPRRRPAFMNVMCLSWTYRPELIWRVAQALGPDYQPVLPSQMAELFRQWQLGGG